MDKSDAPDLIAQLQRVEHFKRLPEVDVRAIVTAGRVRRFAAGETLFAEGAPCAGMFVLLTGQVHLRKLGPQGQESILAVIEPVIMFNEVAVLDGGANLTTAVAAQDCTVWQIGCDRFQALLARYPMIGLGLLRVLARRNRFLVSQVEDLSFRTVQARAAKLLLDLSDCRRAAHRPAEAPQPRAGRAHRHRPRGILPRAQRFQAQRLPHLYAQYDRSPLYRGPGCAG